MNPYHPFVSGFARLMAEGTSLPLGGIAPHQKPGPSTDAPAVLIFSPHPDDECIIGGLALRLMRQSGMRVVNVAVTLGSRLDRRQGRLTELRNACGWLGFELEETMPGGLERIQPDTRIKDHNYWSQAAATLAAALARHQPRAIFFPHEQDWNSTHIGTHLLVMDALKSMPAEFKTTLIETEFWGQMAAPNLLVELSTEDVSELVAALSFHVEEVRRNPYHLRLPAWLQDNVRRGAERVGGQGGAAPDMTFATLYRLREWRNGGPQEILTSGRILSVQDNPGSAIGSAGGGSLPC